MSKEKDKIEADIIYFWFIRHTRKKANKHIALWDTAYWKVCYNCIVHIYYDKC